MKVSIENKGANTIAAIEGSIDSQTAPALQESILPAINESSRIVLDMSEVTFVSSAGLRVLLMVYRQVKARDGKVVLVGVSDEIKDVMFMTGFISFFEISATMEEALSN